MQADDDSAGDRYPAVPARAILATTDATERVILAYGHVHSRSASGRLGEYLRPSTIYKLVGNTKISYTSCVM